MIGTVHFLELAENINLIENHVDLIPFDMISKCIKFVKKQVCNTGLQTQLYEA